MAHSAEIVDGIVVRVVVVNDDYEDTIEKWCKDFFGGNWKQTSYNNTIRNKFAGIGDIYDSIDDVFISPQPFPSWSLDDEHDWQPPVDYPDDAKQYDWKEETLSWELI